MRNNSDFVLYPCTVFVFVKSFEQITDVRKNLDKMSVRFPAYLKSHVVYYRTVSTTQPTSSHSSGTQPQ